MEWRSSIEPKRERAARDNVSTTSGRAREGERTAKKYKNISSIFYTASPGRALSSAPLPWLSNFSIYTFSISFLRLVVVVVGFSSLFSSLYIVVVVPILSNSLYYCFIYVAVFSVCTINSLSSHRSSRICVIGKLNNHRFHQQRRLDELASGQTNCNE